jgi:hypothetical protein
MSESIQPLVSPWDAHNQELVSNVRPADWKKEKPIDEAGCLDS